MPLQVRPLSLEHQQQLTLAVERALQQWVPTAHEPHAIVAALDRVLLFLRQNGGASVQSRQVASLAFCFGAQVVKGGGWSWHSVSEDDGINPALVSTDGAHAVLVVDVVTELVLQSTRGSLVELHRACADGLPNSGILALAT